MGTNMGPFSSGATPETGVVTKPTSIDPLNTLYTASHNHFWKILDSAYEIITQDENCADVYFYTHCSPQEITRVMYAIKSRIFDNPDMGQMMASAMVTVCPGCLIVPLLAKLGVDAEGAETGFQPAGFVGESWLSSVMTNSANDTRVAAMLPTIMAASPSPLIIMYLFEILRLLKEREVQTARYYRDNGLIMTGGVFGN